MVRQKGSERDVGFFYDEKAGFLTIRKPEVLVTDEWDIVMLLPVC